MKTVITISKDVQTSMDDYTVEYHSKIFDDNTTLGEIKDWIISETGMKIERDKLRLSGTKISDIN